MLRFGPRTALSAHASDSHLDRHTVEAEEATDVETPARPGREPLPRTPSLSRSHAAGVYHP